MSFLSNLFGGGGHFTNPYDSAINTYEPYGDMLDPYMQQGSYALPREHEAINNMMAGNGTQQINDIMSHYSASPYAKYQEGQAQKAANNAASVGGLIGTPQEQQALAQNISGIVSKDQQNYLNNALGQYNRGFGGLSALGNMGFGATQQYGDYLGNLANYKAQQQAAQNQYDAQKRKNMLSGIGNLIGDVGAFF